MPKLTVDLRPNETLAIGDARIRLERKSGQLARLSIDAPAKMPVTPPRRANQSDAPSPRGSEAPQ